MKQTLERPSGEFSIIQLRREKSTSFDVSRPATADSQQLPYFAEDPRESAPREWSCRVAIYRGAHTRPYSSRR